MDIIFLLPVEAIVIAAPIGATILGWMAVSRIRNSEGTLRGLGLALFDGLLFPLLTLNALIGALFVIFFRALAQWTSNAILAPFVIVLLSTIATAIIVDVLIVRRVWRAVRNPGGEDAPEGTMPVKTQALIAGFLALLAGLALAGIGSGYAYQAWQFKYKAFGQKITYGILSPEYAYARLLKSRNLRARDASLRYIVGHRKHLHPVIADTLNATFGHKELDSIPPMAALAMQKFDLSQYLRHPNPQQRLAAVATSRRWNCSGKTEVLRTFLEDQDKYVVDQTIYELGYIGDPSVLDILSESRFDNNAFVEKVRTALTTGETFR